MDLCLKKYDCELNDLNILQLRIKFHVFSEFEEVSPNCANSIPNSNSLMPSLIAICGLP